MDGTSSAVNIELIHEIIIHDVDPIKNSSENLYNYLNEMAVEFGLSSVASVRTIRTDGSSYAFVTMVDLRDHDYLVSRDVVFRDMCLHFEPHRVVRVTLRPDDLKRIQSSSTSKTRTQH